MTNGYFVGVDGGGTKTAIVLVDQDGSEISRHVTSTSNAAVIGHDAAARTLREAVSKIVTDAGIDNRLTGIWCGLSGSDRPEDQARLRPHLEDLCTELRMTNDAELALGGLPTGAGVALVSGTGSIAFGRNAAGERARAGGWGHIFGDYGSGYDVARKGLTAYSAMIDGYGPETSLVERFMEHWQLAEPFTLIQKVYDPATTKGDIAKLSRLVVAEAASGDEVSRKIIADVATDLATYCDAVIRRLALGPNVDLALVGGMLTHVDVFREDVIRQLSDDLNIANVALVTDPALTAAQSIAATWKENHT